MKFAIIILFAILVTRVVSGADEESLAINPVKADFSWKKDADNIPQERDPMTPVDYIWPRPTQSKEQGSKGEPKVKARLELAVEFISYSDNPENRFVKVKGISEFMEEGKEYSFKAKGQKVVFKIERIDQDKVVVNYEGEVLEFKPKTFSEDIKSKRF